MSIQSIVPSSFITASTQVESLYLELSQSAIASLNSTFVTPANQAKIQNPSVVLFTSEAPSSAFGCCFPLVGSETTVDVTGFASDAYTSAATVVLSDETMLKNMSRPFTKVPFTGTFPRLHVPLSTANGVNPEAAKIMLTLVNGVMCMTPIVLTVRICMQTKAGHRLTSFADMQQWVSQFATSGEKALSGAMVAAAATSVPYQPVINFAAPVAAAPAVVAATPIKRGSAMMPSAPSKPSNALLMSNINQIQRRRINEEFEEAAEAVEPVAAAKPEVVRKAGDMECTTEGCNEFFVPNDTETHCEDCRTTGARYKALCASEGCGDVIIMTGKQISFLKKKHGDDYYPYKFCRNCNEQKKAGGGASVISEEVEHVYDEPCMVDGCLERVLLTQSEYDFFTSQKKDSSDFMELPKRCIECRAEHKKSKGDLMTGECGHMDCKNKVFVTEATLRSLEAKGLVPHCQECRETFTLNCVTCSSSFFSKANQTEFASKGWKPPQCCTKVCKQERDAKRGQAASTKIKRT